VAPEASGKWQISALSRFPVWTRNGKQLLFRSESGHIMAVDYTTSGDSFIAGKPRQWSEVPIYLTANFQDFDLDPDSKRAVVVALSDAYKEGLGSPHVVFLLNFFDEVKRRLP
jgi:serine/threonine-protein kinase